MNNWYHSRPHDHAEDFKQPLRTFLRNKILSGTLLCQTLIWLKTLPVETETLIQCLCYLTEVLSIISNTRDSASSHFQEESWKYDAQRSIFDKIRSVWKCDETLSRVFDISSQSKLKLRSKRRIKIVKIYAN